MNIGSSIAAVVTGGASGLGEATVRTLAAAGVRVGIFDRNREAGARVADDVGGLYVEVDVLSDESVDTGFAKARAAHGQERILVNCAGSGNAIKTVRRDKATGEVKIFPSDDFAWVLMLNTVGTFRCITRAAAGMLSLDLVDGERGVIVNVASVAAQEGQIGQAAYAASKAAVIGMTLPIARDLSAESIRVNSIMPGLFATPAMLSAPDPVLQSLAGSVPFPKRLGQPAEFASLVLEIVRNGYLNGETIRLDGAIRMGIR
jgi:NAD(P)-dependent dehydrogenase (short-subunit alcohol dehydrogenase family)